MKSQVFWRPLSPHATTWRKEPNAWLAFLLERSFLIIILNMFHALLDFAAFHGSNWVCLDMKCRKTLMFRCGSHSTSACESFEIQSDPFCRTRLLLFPSSWHNVCKSWSAFVNNCMEVVPSLKKWTQQW